MRVLAATGFRPKQVENRAHACKSRVVAPKDPEPMGWATILVELVGGLAVLVGAFVPWVSVPTAAVLLVAAFTVHLPFKT